jgi:hypothetical protein
LTGVSSSALTIEFFWLFFLQESAALRSVAVRAFKVVSEGEKFLKVIVSWLFFFV